MGRWPPFACGRSFRLASNQQSDDDPVPSPDNAWEPVVATAARHWNPDAESSTPDLAHSRKLLTHFSQPPSILDRETGDRRHGFRPRIPLQIDQDQQHQHHRQQGARRYQHPAQIGLDEAVLLISAQRGRARGDPSP